MTRIAPATPAFDDIKPFPGENTLPPRDHNRPPLEEMIVLDFEEALDSVENLRDRIKYVIQKAADLPACTNQEMAGKLGDFAKIAKTCLKVIDGKHDEIKRPFLTATRNLDAKKRGYTDVLNAAVAAAERKVTDWINEERRKEAARLAEERAAREAEDRARREAEAAQAGFAPEPEPVVEEVQTKAKPAPMATGDYGARVGTVTRWVHEPVTSLKGIAPEVLKHPKVLEAVNTVVASMVRTGTRELKGVTIKQETTAAIR